MTTPFGPQLIGETEKTLNALLLRHLHRRRPELTEPQWVTFRVATHARRHRRPRRTRHRGRRPRPLPRRRAARRRPHRRGLLDDGHLTSEGRELLARLQASIADDASAIFDDLAPDDVATTERVLNELLSRARVVLAT